MASASVDRLILLNNPSMIHEIFIERADLVSNKVSNYLESQLRYKEGKHIRTGKNKKNRMITNLFLII